jgi:hypothetical protein
MKKHNGKEGQKQSKSVPIVFPTWKGSRAYRASAELECAGYSCGKTIGVGELYTRHKPQAASYHYSVHAFCRDCVPFVEVERTYEALHDEYQQSHWGQADELEWQEKYGNRPVFGANVCIVEVHKE